MPIMSRFLGRFTCEVNIFPTNNRAKTMSIQCNCKTNEFLRSLFAEAVRSVQPATLIKNQITYINSHLTVGTCTFPANQAFYAVGFGKAVLGMALELEHVLGNHLQRSVVTVPTGIFEKFSDLKHKSKKINFMEGAENNIPDDAAFKGAIEIKHLVEHLGEEDVLFVLISGGGSALLPYPKPPVTLVEKQTLIKSLSRSGATIQELNTVRKQLSLLKGGGLAKLAYPARVVSLILSDVVGDFLDIIASGPTVVCREDPKEAVKVLEKYGLLDGAPKSIREVLEKCPKEPENEFEHVSNFIIGTNRIATEAAKNLALQLDFQCVIVSHKVESDVSNLAENYAKLALSIKQNHHQNIKEAIKMFNFELEDGAQQEILNLDSTRNILLIFAGEPTVQVIGNGIGGRNQQLALTFSLQLNKQGTKTANSGNISLLSAGTDGIDGPTDAAGAIGSTELATACARLGINPESYLQDNDCYSFYRLFQDGKFLVNVGHTGTNVMDLHFLLIEPHKKV